MMEFFSLALRGARYILESGLFWKLLLFWIVFRIARVVTRAHLSKDASFDVTDMIRNHSLPGKPIDVMLTFYATGALVTTVIYAIACTRPSASIQDINIFTVTYGGLWVLSDLGRKVAGRPAVVLPPPAAAPTVTVNNQAQTTPDGTGNG